MIQERDETIFELNRPQAEVQLVKANETWFVAGRGTGKTTGGIAPYLIDCVQAMPGATGVIVANSYEQMKTRTLPPVVAAWTEMGFREWDPIRGGHFTIGKAPPVSFDRPKIPVLQPEKFIHWYNGTVIAMVSLAVKGSANALSVQFGSFDEVKFMDSADVKEVLKVFRGLEKYFGQCSQYLSKFFATDKWADLGDIKWILSKKKLMDPRRIELTKSLAIKTNELLLELHDLERINEHETPAAEALKKKIKLHEETLTRLRRDEVFYCESSAVDNVKNLSPKYIETQRRDLTQNEFNVAILNEDPTTIQGLFYPAFKKPERFYNLPDYFANRPLIIATDYQHSIAPVCITQLAKLPGEEVTSLNYIDSLFTLHPLQLSDAIALFCSRYQSHRNRNVYYVFDHTAIGKKSEGDPDYKTVLKILKFHHFNAIETYIGQAPRHFTKYSRINDFLENKNGTRYPTRVNEAKNPDLITSIGLAEAGMSQGKTVKVKKYEDTHHYPDFPQQEATHFSDVFDQIQWAVNELGLIREQAAYGFGIGLR